MQPRGAPPRSGGGEEMRPGPDRRVAELLKPVRLAYKGARTHCAKAGREGGIRVAIALGAAVGAAGACGARLEAKLADSIESGEGLGRVWSAKLANNRTERGLRVRDMRLVRTRGAAERVAHSVRLRGVLKVRWQSLQALEPGGELHTYAQAYAALAAVGLVPTRDKHDDTTTHASLITAASDFTAPRGGSPLGRILEDMARCAEEHASSGGTQCEAQLRFITVNLYACCPDKLAEAGAGLSHTDTALPGQGPDDRQVTAVVGWCSGSCFVDRAELWLAFAPRKPMRYPHGEAQPAKDAPPPRESDSAELDLNPHRMCCVRGHGVCSTFEGSKVEHGVLPPYPSGAVRLSLSATFIVTALRQQVATVPPRSSQKRSRASASEPQP